MLAECLLRFVYDGYRRLVSAVDVVSLRLVETILGLYYVQSKRKRDCSRVRLYI